MQSVERFSDRVANYVKYRPSYPAEMLQFFRDELGLTTISVLADIGSGTGLSSRPFLDNGNVVYGVEPNTAMREAAETFLRTFENFKSIEGTSGATNLPDSLVDFVIAAQAFHWFEPEPTRKEFKRILKPDGNICLIWNERQLNTTSFLVDYEKLLLKFANDYQKVRHENIDAAKLASFFLQEVHHKSFANQQILDFHGLKGRVLSSSYMPNEGDPKFEPMIKELKELFAKYEQGGKIAILYDTNVYYSKF